jgi:predicted RNA-binding Zn-ribbon protein involved in translation (DUF1610 family)
MSASKPIKRTWTDGEVRRLELLINNRFSRDEIARLLGRTPASIQQKAFWLKPVSRAAGQGLIRGTHQGMNRAMQPITVVFACPKCATVYRASQYRGVGTHFGAFNCVACHARVYAWQGLYDFLDWQVGLSSAPVAGCR